VLEAFQRRISNFNRQFQNSKQDPASLEMAAGHDRCYTPNDIVNDAIKQDPRIKAADERYRKNGQHTASAIIAALGLAAVIPFVAKTVTKKDVPFSVLGRELYHAVNAILGPPHVAAKTILYVFRFLCRHLGYPESGLDGEGVIIGHRERNKPDTRGRFYGVKSMLKTFAVPPQCKAASEKRDASSKRGLEDKKIGVGMSQRSKRAHLSQTKKRRKLAQQVKVLSGAQAHLNDSQWTAMLATADKDQLTRKDPEKGIVSLAPKLGVSTTAQPEVKAVLFAPQGPKAHRGLGGALVGDYEEQIHQGDTRVSATCAELQVQWEAKNSTERGDHPQIAVQQSRWSEARADLQKKLNEVRSLGDVLCSPPGHSFLIVVCI
jgi:hypothetical protein